MMVRLYDIVCVLYRDHLHENDASEFGKFDNDVLKMMASSILWKRSQTRLRYIQYFGTRRPPPRRCNFPTKAAKYLTAQRTPRMRCCLARLLVSKQSEHRVQPTARWNTFILSHTPGEVPGPAYSHFITCGGHGC